MPAIRSSADLRNNYNEISTFCHNYPEPVFITKNGKGDLAVMSIEAYEELTSRFELQVEIYGLAIWHNGVILRKQKAFGVALFIYDVVRF